MGSYYSILFPIAIIVDYLCTLRNQPLAPLYAGFHTYDIFLLELFALLSFFDLDK